MSTTEHDVPFLVSDTFIDEAWNLSDKAFRLYTAAGCWSSRQRTYGWVSNTGRLASEAGPVVIAELVDAGFWEPAEHGGWNYTGIGTRCKFQVDGRLRPRIPDHVRYGVYARDGYSCQECGTTEQLSLDHIRPWSKGGSDSERNLRTLCTSCNSRKGARLT